MKPLGTALTRAREARGSDDAQYLRCMLIDDAADTQGGVQVARGVSAADGGGGSSQPQLQRMVRHGLRMAIDPPAAPNATLTHALDASSNWSGERTPSQVAILV